MRAKHFAWTLLLPLAVACGNQPRQMESAARLSGYSVDDSNLWSSDSIPTCWENGTDATQDFRTKIRQVVQKAYAPTHVRFTGWDACGRRATPGLHIEIYHDGQAVYRRVHGQYDGHPRAMGLGAALDGARPGVVLNPTLDDVEPFLTEMASTMGDQQLNNLQAAIVVHEFGHVLGLLHEQERLDSPCSDYDDSNSGGGINRGSYDPDSIMNYCVTHTFDYSRPLTLSKGDITTLNTLYP